MKGLSQRFLQHTAVTFVNFGSYIIHTEKRLTVVDYQKPSSENRKMSRNDSLNGSCCCRYLFWAKSKDT